MSSVPFHYIDLRTFCYETEADKRVEAALKHFLPAEFEVQHAESRGHHGDRIVVFSARVESADGMRHVLSTLREGADVETLREQVGERVTENCEFFAHLDKQEAYQGETRLGEGISLRAKVEAYPAKQEAAIENAREAF